MERINLYGMAAAVCVCLITIILASKQFSQPVTATVYSSSILSSETELVTDDGQIVAVHGVLGRCGDRFWVIVNLNGDCLVTGPVKTSGR